MDRLTKRQAFTVGGVIYAKCEHCQDKRPECFGEQCPVPDEALISLAAYEDTGLEPEEIKQMCALARLNSNIFDNDFGNHIAELIVAERDGRLVLFDEAAARAEAAEAERDAAVEDLKIFSACCQCNANIDGSCCDMFDGTAENKYFLLKLAMARPTADRERSGT